MLLPFADQIVGQRLGKQSVEGGHEVSTDYLVVVDVEPLEETLIQVATTVVLRSHVVPLGTGQQTADVIELRAQPVLSHLVAAQRLLVHRALGRNSKLFTAQVLEIYGVGVVRLQEFAALMFEVEQPSLRRLTLLRLIWHHLREVVEHLFANGLDSGVGECVLRPMVLNELLYQADLDGAEGAAVLIRLSSETVEVLVVVTEPATGALV